jgi:GT2 family glycosyltransferase
MRRLAVKKVDLSIIILNYNTRDFLRRCLLSILKSKKNGFNYELIVVDNASSDDSVKMVKRRFPKIKLLVNKRNLGFSAGNNLGIKRAQGRFVLLLNPDTLVFPETFKVMMKFMESNPQTGAATCRVELTNGKLDHACHRGFPTPWNALTYFSGLARRFPKTKLFSGYTLSWQPLNKIHEIDSACGSFLFIRRQAGEEVGWLDEDYFWYGEDLDFCYRLKKKNWQVMFVPRTKIIHYKGVSSGIKKHSQKMATASKTTKLRSIKAHTQVMRIFYQKHLVHCYPRPVYWLVILGINLLEKINLRKLSI